MKKLLTILLLFIASVCYSQKVIWVYHDTVTFKPLYNRGNEIAYYDATVNYWGIRDTMFLINVLIEQILENKNKNYECKHCTRKNDRFR